MPRAAALLVFLLLTASVALFAAQFEPGAWYASLAKPSWTPPDAIFAPVWSVLYVMIALAGWLAWRARPEPASSNTPVLIWAIALVLNGLWSGLFFGLHVIGPALLEIGLLWLAIFAFILTAWSRSRAAALLFVPYLAWVSYAAALNAAIWGLM